MDRTKLGIAIGDALRLERSRRRVETGMQNGAVALGSPVQNVGRLFQKTNPPALKRQAARDGTADNAAANDCDIKRFRYGGGIGGAVLASRR